VYSRYNRRRRGLYAAAGLEMCGRLQFRFDNRPTRSDQIRQRLSAIPSDVSPWPWPWLSLFSHYMEDSRRLEKILAIWQLHKACRHLYPDGICAPWILVWENSDSQLSPRWKFFSNSGYRANLLSLCRPTLYC